jgi:hypothetical protein
MAPTLHDLQKPLFASQMGNNETEMAYTLHHNCLLIDIHQPCALNYVSVHKLVFNSKRFGTFFAPSSGMFNVSILIQHTVTVGSSSHLSLCSIQFNKVLQDARCYEPLKREC